MAENQIFFQLNLQTGGAIKTFGQLKAETKALRKELDQTKIGTKRFAELETRIRANTKAQTEFNRRLRGSGTLAQGVSKGMIDAFKKVGVLLVAGLGIQALIRGFKALVAITSEFEFNITRTGAILQATKGEFEALTATAQELGETTVFTARQAAEAMTLLAQAGFSANEVIEATPKVLQLAVVGAVDLTTAAEIAANTLRGFGFEASELGRVNDVMAKAIISSNQTIRDFGEGFKLVAPIAKSAGLQFEEISAAIGILSDAGLKGTRAGTSLRQAISKLLKPSRQAEGVIKSLGLNVLDAQGNMLPFADIVEQLGEKSATTAEILKIFGVRAGPGIAVLVEKGADALRDFTTELENSGGTAQEISERQLDTFQGTIKLLKSALEGLAIIIGNILLPIIRGLADGLTEVVSVFNKLIGQRKEINQLQLETTVNTVKESRRLQELFEEYEQLTEDGIKPTADEKARLDEITVSLRKAFGDSVIEINKETGALELNREQVIKNLKTRLALGNEQVQQQLLRALALIEEAKNIDALIKIQEKATEILEENVKANDAGNTIRGRTNEQINEQNKRTRDLATEQQNLEDLENKRAIATIEFGKIMKELLALGIDLNDILETQADQFVDLGLAADRLNEQENKLSKAEKKRLQEARKLQEEKKKAREKLIEEQEKFNKEVLFRTQSLIEQEEELFQQELINAGIRGLAEQERTKEQQAILEQLEKEHADRIKAINQDLIDKNLEIQQAAFDAEKQIHLARIGLVTDLGNALQQLSKDEGALFKIGLVLEKASAIASVIVANQVETATIAATFAAAPPVAAALITAARVKAAIRIAVIAATTISKFDEGGFTGESSAAPDSTGERPAGIVHAGEWVAPRTMVESPRTAGIISQLEGMRRGFADGGFTSFQPNIPISTDTSTSQILNALAGINFAPIVSVVEFERVQNRVKTVEQSAST